MIYESWRITFQSSEQAAQSAYQTVCELAKERDELQGDIATLEQENRQMRARNERIEKERKDEYESLRQEIKTIKEKKMARFSSDECWIYEKGEDNHLRSLVCPVVIRAVDLDEIIQQRDELLVSIEQVLNSAAPEWETESGIIEFSEACKSARSTVAKAKGGA